MSSSNEKVIAELKTYLESDKWKKLRTKNPKYTQWIENITDKDISFGPNPKFILGKVYGNSTAVGESSYGNTTSQRTISLDHVSVTKCFVDLSNRADKKTLLKAHKAYYTGSQFYYQNQAREIAKQDGKYKTYEHLSDLNFNSKSYRLNRYNIEYVGETKSCSLWPILAKQGERNVFIGYRDEHTGKSVIDFEIVPPMPPVKKLIIGGIVVAIIAIGALVFSLGKCFL